jgi:L-alanine-DL-glutamate epimerase-like enolase superfamily enzyme
MKINNILTTKEKILLKTPFITSIRRVDNVEFIRVKISCDDGSVGIGEAPATLAITGEDLETINSSILNIKDDLIGVNIQSALEILHSSKIGSSAKASLDIALVFLLAKMDKKSMSEFFNIKNFRPVKTDITISLNEKLKMLKDAKEAYNAGKEILKVKLGSDIKHSIDITKELSKELPFAKLLIDANQAWSLDDSLRYIDAIKDLNIELVEQPVVAKDLEALKQITKKSPIAILADESVFTLEDVKKVVESKSADMINIKLMKCGGVSKAVEILEYARDAGVKCMLGSMLEGPYSINAALYLAFAYRDVIAYVDLDSPLLYKSSSDELNFIFNGCEISPSTF